jgi:ubiquinone biosynthesis protein COQ4
MNPIQKITTASAFIKLIKDPTKTDQVFRIASGVINGAKKDTTQPLVDYVLSHPEFKKLYDEKYLAPKIDVEALLKLPENTLGYCFGHFLRDNNLDPEFFPKLTTDDPVRYTVMRARQTHDIFHVLTGYSSSVTHEVALQAFTYAQLKSPLAAILIAMSILHFVIYRPKEIPTLMDEIVNGYQRGKKAKFMLGVPWEQLFDRPLAELRSNANIIH